MNAAEMPLATVWQPLSQIVITKEGVRNLFYQFRTCGDEENRTLNPRLAKAVLCQLSYVPWRSGSAGEARNRHHHPPEQARAKPLAARRSGVPGSGGRSAGGLVPEGCLRCRGLSAPDHQRGDRAANRQQ